MFSMLPSPTGSSCFSSLFILHLLSHEYPPVQRELFNNLLANYTSLTSDEANELASLSNDFPYSQVIHNLAARAAQDNALTSKEKLLTVSAIYSTDRGSLKSMITAPIRPHIEEKKQSVAKQP